VKLPTLPWMSRTDRRRWRAAGTLAELGELVALWLEGEIASRPGYQPRYGPDEETRELIPVLAAACRAGVVTTGSQPGAREIGADGAFWLQRAAVDAVIGDPQLLRRLVDAAEEAGLDIVINDLLNTPGEGAIPVTTRDGEIVTAFGGALSGRDLHMIWSGCSGTALDEVFTAAQVTLVDPTFGPSNRLWATLASVAAGEPLPQDLAEADDDQAQCTVCGCTDEDPCPGGCWWVPGQWMQDLCSACSPTPTA
jgi:hypothetical protein